MKEVCVTRQSRKGVVLPITEPWTLNPFSSAVWSGRLPQLCDVSSPAGWLAGWHQCFGFSPLPDETPGGIPVSWDPLSEWSGKGSECLFRTLHACQDHLGAFLKPAVSPPSSVERQMKPHSARAWCSTELKSEQA